MLEPKYFMGMDPPDAVPSAKGLGRTVGIGDQGFMK